MKTSWTALTGSTAPAPPPSKDTQYLTGTIGHKHVKLDTNFWGVNKAVQAVGKTPTIHSETFTALMFGKGSSASKPWETLRSLVLLWILIDLDNIRFLHDCDIKRLHVNAGHRCSDVWTDSKRCSRLIKPTQKQPKSTAFPGNVQMFIYKLHCLYILIILHVFTDIITTHNYDSRTFTNVHVHVRGLAPTPTHRHNKITK